MAARVRAVRRWIDRQRARPTTAAGVEVPSGGRTRRRLIGLGAVLGGLGLALVLFLTWFDWDKARGPVARFASSRIHRTVSIDGHLRVHLLTWSPSVTVWGLRVAQPGWAQPGDMIVVRQATASIRLPQLLRGRVLLPVVDLQQPRIVLIRDLEGRANWRFSDTPARKAASLPPIRRFTLTQGQLRYDDARARLSVVGTLEAREKRSGPYDQGFHLDGRGSLNGNPFLLKVIGGPMINIDPGRPYPFQADVRGGATRILARGSITRPFDFGAITAAMTVSGADMNDLYALTRLALPNTPPYRLSGLMTRDQSRFQITGITGKVGDSDLNGVVGIETRGRLTVRADLTSRLLDLDDLMTVMGGAPDPRETASPAQAVMARTMAAQGRLLPDATLQIDRLRSMDAVLTYRAASVRSPRLPVRAAAVDLKLDHGVLDLDPFRFRLVSGEVVGKARIDGRTAVPVTDFDARLSGVNIQQFIRSRSGAPPIEGLVQARAKLHGVGASVHQAAGKADGDITIVVPHGRIRQAFAELLGVNIGKGLYLLLNKDPRQTDLRCAIAHFKVTGGVARASHIVIDTGVVTATGSGTIDLGAERLNLVVEGKSKKPRLLRLWAPITLTGSLAAPRPGVQTQKVVAQAGIAAALGSVLSPLAALLPFVDAGLAKDADCAALIGTANAAGASVKGGPR